jgi:hypothetical protein
MSIALISLTCIFGGVLFGMWLSNLLPDHHLSSESKDTVKLGAGIVATMAALVLGILVGSAKSSFDTITNGITEVGTKVIMLDRTLAQYGPESKDVRAGVLGTIETAVRHLWPEEKTGENHLKAMEKSTGTEDIQSAIKALSPKTEAQRQLQARAEQINNDIIQLRWMLIENQQKSIPTPLLVVLVFWLTTLFISFGLFAARNMTVVVTLFISALSVSAALFIILEMSGPLEGMIKVSSAPLRKALEHMGKSAGQ